MVLQPIVGLKSLLDFLQYRLDIFTKKRNQAIMKENLFNQLYAEIDRILPSVEYCLAPNEVSVAQGAEALRASVAGQVSTIAKDPRRLDRHAKILYEWLDPEKQSHIRMLLQ